MVSAMDADVSPPAKRQCVEELEGTDIGGLPKEIWIKIFRLLGLKDQVWAGQTCWRWHELMPLWDGNSTLKISQLPYANQFVTSCTIASEGITAALHSLLPKIGAKLKGISCRTGPKGLESNLTNSHLDLIIQCCPALTDLDFEGIWLFHVQMQLDRFIEQLRQLKAVKFLSLPNLDRFGAAQTFPNDLASLMNSWPLERLKLADFNILPPFSCPQLTELSLIGCSLTNMQLAEICRISPNLTTLATEVPSNPNLTPITTLAHLIDLQLGQKFGIWAAEVARVLLGSPNLVRLYTHVDIDTGSLDQLKQLKTLSIGLSSWAIQNLADDWELSSLESLSSVDGIVSDAGLTTLSAKLPCLQELAIPNTFVSDASMSALVANCPLLKTLDLSGTKVTGRCLALLGVANQLKDLRICQWQEVGVDAFWSLCAGRKKNGVKTPLRVTLDSYNPIWKSQCFVQLSTELAEVNVTVVKV